jgi:hypothetical protein
MHILGGVVLLAVAVLAIFLISSSGAFQRALGPLSASFGGRATSTQAEVSEYRGEVDIRFVSLGGAPGEAMSVALRGTMTRHEEGIILSGWSIRTNMGAYAIPKAVNLYSPSVQGVPPEDIYFRPGGTVTLYSGSNPRSGQPQAIRSGSSEWQIYLGENFLAVPHGAIILRDGRGLEVDRYEY